MGQQKLLAEILSTFLYYVSISSILSFEKCIVFLTMTKVRDSTKTPPCFITEVTGATNSVPKNTWTSF